jgi:4-oxalocrotonate tautomerase
MPWVTINMLEGRAEEKKLKLHDAVAKAVAESLDISPDIVQVQIVEMKKEHYSKGGVSPAKP